MYLMATPIEFVEEQWQEWTKSNPLCLHVDTDELKRTLVSDLTIASKMDVREYTLYQKWSEVHEKYPTVVKETLFGSELQMVDPTQKYLINKIKKNFYNHKDEKKFRGKF